MIEFSNEIWRDVVGYEELYEVSNCGRVKSLNYNHTGKEQILKPGKHKNGYLFVHLCKGGKKKGFKVHRLVAEAFIPNPNSLPQVNHRDEDKTNNFVFISEDGSVDFNKSNLEWITLEGNLKYGTRLERVAKTLSKPVAQYTLDGELVKIWLSVMEVERQTGWCHQAISACCRGKRNSAYRFIWRYVEQQKKPAQLVSRLEKIMGI